MSLSRVHQEMAPCSPKQLDLRHTALSHPLLIRNTPQASANAESGDDDYGFGGGSSANANARVRSPAPPPPPSPPRIPGAPACAPA
jgi:hypothetical protein